MLLATTYELFIVLKIQVFTKKTNSSDKVARSRVHEINIMMVNSMPKNIYSMKPEEEKARELYKDLFCKKNTRCTEVYVF